MIPISVVIITKNEAEMLIQSIPLLKQISDDIIVIDNGSTDDTLYIANEFNCRVHSKNWDGYGANKNKGIELARHNWILSIDGDELPDAALITAISKLNFFDDELVYDIPFKAYYGPKYIRFGTWGRDHHVRLFNRTHNKWTETPVHETLILPKNITVKKLAGHLHHYSAKDADELKAKTILYAQLSAVKYLTNGKNASFAKLYLAPLFHFLKVYVFLLGFLDGAEGFIIARMIFINTRLKYHYLSKAVKASRQKSLYLHKQPARVYDFKNIASAE